MATAKDIEDTQKAFKLAFKAAELCKVTVLASADFVETSFNCGELDEDQTSTDTEIDFDDLLFIPNDLLFKE